MYGEQPSDPARYTFDVFRSAKPLPLPDASVKCSRWARASSGSCYARYCAGTTHGDDTYEHGGFAVRFSPANPSTASPRDGP